MTRHYKICFNIFTMIIFPVMLISCSFLSPSAEDVWQRNETDFRKDLDVLYPPGTLRDKILEREWKPKETCYVNQESMGNWYINKCVRTITAELMVTPVRYDFYWVPRMGYLPIPIGAGLWGDYIFYDKNDKVIKSYRRFLD